MIQKDIISEAELITGMRRQDERALRVVYKAHFGLIAHFIYQNNGSEQEAKDIYQEAFIVLYEKLKDQTFQLNCQIKTFLYSVSRRLWLKKLNEKKHYVGKLADFEPFIATESPEIEAPESEKQFSSMSQSLRQIGEPCKTILEDYYLQKMTMQAIADKFGYTNADNAKNQKYKCLQRLKKLFFKEYNEENQHHN
jgi:RNA polymerase sigma factor (sigma-70 family)